MSMWLDWVHWIGISGGVLAVIALLIGLMLFFRIGGKGFTWHNKMRQKHMWFGAVAVSLAILHTVFRLIAIKELPFEPIPPVIAFWAFLVVAISGRLRYKPLEFLIGKSTIMIWIHRVVVIIALVGTIRHILYTVSNQFM